MDFWWLLVMVMMLLLLLLVVTMGLVSMMCSSMMQRQPLQQLHLSHSQPHARHHPYPCLQTSSFLFAVVLFV